MSQGDQPNKRPAAAGGSLASGSTKRLRTSKGHTSNCDDPECAGCADGAISLAPDVLGMPAHELGIMAEQEEAEGADRSVVTKLYETALEKFGGEASLSHAWTLLRAAEYIEFSTYAKEALAVLERTETSQDLEDAQMALIRGRARVLLVCLDQNNWRNPSDDSDDDDDDEEDDEDEGAGGGANVAIAGEDALDQGSAEIIGALKRICGLKTSDAYPSAVAGTLASLSSRAERGTLVGKLRLCVMNIALSAVDACVQWEGDSKSPVDSADDLRLLSSKVAVKWALAAADGMVSGEQIEARLKPAATYLDAHPSQTDCCKLRAQMLIVLSSVLSDEDEAINAFDAAVEALKRAHKIDPKDEDVASQLEDLGVGI